MERETKSFTTPVGKQEFVIKTYLTGREKRALTNVYLSENVQFDTETQNIKGLNGALVDKAQNLAFETIIVSIEGKTSSEINLVDAILDMRSEDFDFVVTEINKITSNTDFLDGKRS